MIVVQNIQTEIANLPIASPETRYGASHRLSLSRETKANPNPVEDDILNGDHVHRAFENRGLGTGGLTPYHGLLRHDEVIEQLLPLSRRGSHAGGYNRISWALACVGNYDKTPMPSWMRYTLIELWSILGIWNNGLIVVSHCPGLAGSSKDEDKRCPGQFVDMREIYVASIRARPRGYEAWTMEQCRVYIEDHGFTF